MSFRTLRTALIAGLALTLAACDMTPDTPAAERVVHRGNGGEPGSLDPALADDVHAFNILIDLYEGLVTEAADGSLMPGVARSWTVSNDGLIYTFELRDDARWSDGSPVIADDFVRALRRVASPATAAAYAFLLEPIYGFTEALAGQATVEEIGVTAADAATLVIELARPAAHLPALLALPVAYPAHPQGVESGISNGAFVLESRQAGTAVTLARNPNYREADKVAPDKVVYLPIVDLAAELNMFLAGELDITNSLPPDFSSRVPESARPGIRIAPMLALYYLAFDLTEAPFDELALRQALSLAIDRDELVAVLGRGERPAYSIVPPGTAAYEGREYAWRAFSSKERENEARRHYALAGYGDDRPLSIRLTYDVGDVHETIALAIESMWREVLGVDVELDKREWAYFLDTRFAHHEWDAMRFAWFGDYNSPMTFLEIFASNHPQNFARYSGAGYDGLLGAAGREPDQGKAAAIMRGAEASLMEDYAIAPLYFYVSKHLVSPRIGGFEDNPMDRHPSRFLTFNDERRD